MGAFKLLITFLFLVFSATTAQKPGLQTNVEALANAMDNMRSSTYYGFVILLEMLNKPNIVTGNGITFLIPTDRELADHKMTQEQLQDFVLRHTINSTLYFNDMLHFPTGTLIPVSAPGMMIRITNQGTYNFYVNNAKVVTANICQGPRIKCHGINAVLQYNQSVEHQPGKNNIANPEIPLPRYPFFPKPVIPHPFSSDDVSPAASPVSLPAAVGPEVPLGPRKDALLHTGSIGAAVNIRGNVVGVVLLACLVLFL